MLKKETFENDLKTAMREGNEVGKRTLRMVLTAIKLSEVDRQESLDEMAITALLQKEVKSRQETIEEAMHAGREDLVTSTRAEIEFLQGYLPEPISTEELAELVRQTISEVEATGPQDMGRVMKVLMPRVQGRADGKTVSTAVQASLAHLGQE